MRTPVRNSRWDFSAFEISSRSPADQKVAQGEVASRPIDLLLWRYVGSGVERGFEPSGIGKEGLIGFDFRRSRSHPPGPTNRQPLYRDRSAIYTPPEGMSRPLSPSPPSTSKERGRCEWRLARARFCDRRSS